MIFCARATRGRGLPSLDARSGRSVSSHPWRENERAWKDGEGHPRWSCAPGTRALRRASFDGRT